VAGVVVTHGTDTLEETAYFLQHVLAPAKPVVLTAAMRPATALDADGPRNLLDALLLARHPGAQGVVAVLAGQALAADELRKLHTWRLDAFASDGGPVATVADGRVRVLRPWPQSAALGLQALPTDVAHWPRVAVLPSHAGIDGALMSAIVQTLQAQGVDGLVVAGTGNATLHGALRAALQEAQAAGVVVWRATRCPLGPLLGEDEAAPPAADGLSPYQARIALMLALMAQRQRPAAERRKLRPPSA
jgi:L-asparaginase